MGLRRKNSQRNKMKTVVSIVVVIVTNQIKNVREAKNFGAN